MIRGLLSLAVFIVCVQASSSEEARRRARPSTHERIVRDGYPSEFYDVTAEDGYILQVNRIPHGRNDSNGFGGRPIAFLMHGLQGSANAFIELGAEKSLAYILADVGFDVWLGNARGVEQSRRHVSLNPDGFLSKRTFWDFTWEEIALYDLPAMIDFILNHTKQQSLHYVGHSQGGTVFLVLNSRKPEFNNKFISAHLLAGVGYQNNFPNWIVKQAASRVEDIFSLSRILGIVEIMGPSKRSLNEDIAEIKQKSNEIEPFGLFGGLIQIIEDALNEFSRAKSIVAGAAVKQYAHYGQNIRDRRFRSWNYGTFLNLMKYGRLSPPEYVLRRITVSTTMHYASGDILLHERDVLAMARDMPNCQVRKVARSSFSHTDFIMADDSKELVNDYIVDDLVAGSRRV